MSPEHWRDAWDRDAERERAAMRGLPVDTLLRRVTTGQFGDYHTIWPAIAERATLPEAGWLLLSVLESGADYTSRYHCAAALLALLHDETWQPVELAAEWGRSKNLPDVRRALEARIGPRIDPGS